MNDRTLTKLILKLDNHIHFTMANRALKKRRSNMSFETWLKILRRLLRYAGTKKAKQVVKWSYD